MNTPKHHLSRHQRQRLVLWALAMLAWIVSVLFGAREFSHRQLGQRHRKMSLAGLEHMAIQLMIIRAVELARLRRPKRFRFYRYGRSLLRPHFIRSLLGSRLRRLIRHKDLHNRIIALFDVLRRMDNYAAMLGARMKRRLTRLHRSAPARTPATPRLGSPVCRSRTARSGPSGLSLACVDTS